MFAEQLQAIQPIIQKIRSLNWVRIGIIVFIILFVSWVWRTFAVIVTDVSSDSSIDGAVSYTSSVDKSRTLVALGSLVIVPRSENSLIAVKGSYATILTPMVPWYGWTGVKGTIEKTKNALRYSNSSDDCINYTPPEDHLLTYACINGSALSEVNVQTGYSKTVHAFPESNAQPFMEGIIGITTSETSPKIFYQTTAGAISYFPTPKNISKADLYTAKVTTDTHIANNPRFIVTTLSGMVAIGTYVNNTAEYTVIQKQPSWQSGMSTECGISNSTAYCHQGLSRRAPALSGDTTPPQIYQSGNLLRIDIKTSSKIDMTTYPTPKGIGSIDALSMVDAHTAAFISGAQLYYFNTDNNSLSVNLVSGKITDIAAAKDGIYFVRENEIYKTSIGHTEARMIYSSNNITVSKLAVDKGTVFFYGMPPTQSENKGIFKLDNSDVTGMPLTDLLPIKYSESSRISDIQYIKNTLYVRLKVAIDKTGSSGVDQNDKKTAEESALKELQQSGIDPAQYDIIFTI